MSKAVVVVGKRRGAAPIEHQHPSGDELHQRIMRQHDDWVRSRQGERRVSLMAMVLLATAVTILWVTVMLYNK